MKRLYPSDHLPAVSPHIIALALACATLTASGGSYLWTGTVSGAWDAELPDNWDGVTPIFDNQADVTFYAANAANFNPSFLGNSDRTIRSLSFNASVTNDVGLQLDDNAGTARQLRFEANSGNATIAVGASATADVTIGSSALGSLFLGSGLDIFSSGVLFINRPISGTGSINKLGAGLVVLGAANTYGGAAIITEGTVRLGVNQAVPSASTVTIRAGTLDLNGKTQDSSTAAAINLGAAVTTTDGLSANVTDSAGGGVLKMNGVAYNAGSAGFHNGQATISASLDLNGAGRFFTINDSTNAAVDVLISGVIVNSVGTAGPVFAATGTTLLSAVNTYNGITTVRGGTVKLDVDNAIPATTFAMDCRSGGTATVDLAGHTVTASYVYLSSGAPNAANSRNLIIDSASGGVLKLNGNLQYIYGVTSRSNGQSTVSAALDLNGTNRLFSIDDSLQTSTEVVVSGSISNSTGTAGITKAGGGNLVLSAENNYNGGTVVNAGALVLAGSGAVPSSPWITVASGGTFDVSGVTGGFTLRTNQLVNGDGSIRGPFTANGMVIPADSLTTGVLTFTNNLQFGTDGAALMNINKSEGVLTNDLIQVFAGSLTYGGALNVTLLSTNEPLVIGDTFSLFSASGGIHGAFISTNLPSSYTWDTSMLSSGTIRVAAINSPIPTTPTNITVSVTPTNITVSWPTNYTGWSLQAQTNALSVGLSNNWSTIQGSEAVSSISFPIDTDNSAVFYRLFYQAP